MIKIALAILLSGLHVEPAKVVNTYGTIVECEISDGNVYGFYDDEQYYQVGDSVMLLMDQDQVVNAAESFWSSRQVKE